MNSSFWALSPFCQKLSNNFTTISLYFTCLSLSLKPYFRYITPIASQWLGICFPAQLMMWVTLLVITNSKSLKFIKRNVNKILVLHRSHQEITHLWALLLLLSHTLQILVVIKSAAIAIEFTIIVQVVIAFPKEVFALEWRL